MKKFYHSGSINLGIQLDAQLNPRVQPECYNTLATYKIFTFISLFGPHHGISI
jgi:hypothetical protein